MDPMSGGSAVNPPETKGTKSGDAPELKGKNPKGGGTVSGAWSLLPIPPCA